MDDLISAILGKNKHNIASAECVRLSNIVIFPPPHISGQAEIESSLHLPRGIVVHSFSLWLNFLVIFATPYLFLPF